LRNFSTQIDPNVKEVELDANLEGYRTEINSDPEFNNKENSLIKEQAIKNFKQMYGGGYLGYTLIHNFGGVSYLMDSDDYYFIEWYTKSLEPKFKIYLKEIPENVTYSILPVLRHESINRKYKAITTANAIKVTRFSSSKLLAKLIVRSLLDALLNYNIRDSDIDFYVMGRPWLTSDDFNIKISEVTKILDKQMEKELSYSSIALLNNKIFSEKAFKLKNYDYQVIYMDYYGEPVYDKNKNLIGYKLSDDEYATIKTYYNDDNLLCNKVSVIAYDENFLSFNSEPMSSWLDIKTDSGFIREYNKKNIFMIKIIILLM